MSAQSGTASKDKCIRSGTFNKVVAALLLFSVSATSTLTFCQNEVFAQTQASQSGPSGQSSQEDIEKFSDRVLDIAKHEYPSLDLKKTKTPLLFSFKKTGRLSLDNLFKVVSEQGRQEEEIRRFLKSIYEITQTTSESTAQWATVKSRLRPQIFPSRYLEKTKKVIVVRPLKFSEKLLEGFVIDSENTFLYVTSDHLQKWNVDIDQVSKCAYENLDKASQDLKFEVNEAGGSDGRGKYVTISVKDGYAAARILLPEVRKRLHKDLGDPCFVAIPNRDFLIAWSPDFTHKLRFEQQVRKDFQNRHHPLTPSIYELGDESLTLPEGARSRKSRRRH